MVTTVTPQEVSVEQFKEGLFRLAGENQVEADQLLAEFKEAVLEDLNLSLQAKKKGKTKEEILFEKWKKREARKHYRTLRRNLGKRPPNTAGHHIVSWYDEGAKAARQILKKFGIDIDSIENGIYLPRFKKPTPHPQMPEAYAHSEIHTEKYYLNITILLEAEANVPGSRKEDIAAVLAEISEELKNGTFPLHKRISTN